MIVTTGGELAYTREDGVKMIPLECPIRLIIETI